MTSSQQVASSPDNGLIAITLETTWNEVGHADDNSGPASSSSTSLLMRRTLRHDNENTNNEDRDDQKVLPMCVFRMKKTFYVPRDRASQVDKVHILKDKQHMTFPSMRLLEGFAQGLTRLLDPTALVDVTKPDLLSVLTSALMLNCDSLVKECIAAMDTNLLYSEFPRALKLAKKFSNSCPHYSEGLFLFALRHADVLQESWEEDPFWDDISVRLKDKFQSLFSSSINPPLAAAAAISTKGYPQLHKFRFERFVLGSGNKRHFVLVREHDSMCICSAVLNNRKDGFWIFAAGKYPCDMRVPHTSNFAGSAEANFLGNVWTVYDNAGARRRTPCGRIVYAQNALGRVPNAMRVELPNLVTLSTKQPRWSEERGYSLDFKGRVTTASKKNFLLLRNEDDLVMSFGKCSKHLFALDIAAPLCPVLGFAIALTTFADKLVVT